MKKPRKPRPGKSKKKPAVIRPTPEAFPETPKQGFRFLIWWGGCILAALTAFGGLHDFFDLADFVRQLTLKWNSFIQLVWSTVFQIDFANYPGAAARLTFQISLLAIAGSAAMTYRDPSQEPANGEFWRSLWRDTVVNPGYHRRLSQAFAMYYLSLALFAVAVDLLIFNSAPTLFQGPAKFVHMFALALSVSVLVAIAISRGFKELAHVVLLTVFVTTFYFAIAFSAATEAAAAGLPSVEKYRRAAIESSFLFSFLQTVSAFSIAPPKYFNARFLIIMAFVLTLVLLNYAAVLKESLP